MAEARPLSAEEQGVVNLGKTVALESAKTSLAITRQLIPAEAVKAKAKQVGT